MRKDHGNIFDLTLTIKNETEEGGGVLSGLVCGSLRLGNHFSTVRPILAGQLVFFFFFFSFPFSNAHNVFQPADKSKDIGQK